MSAPENGFGPHGPDDEVRELMEKAGPRPEIPSEDLARIKAAARNVWDERQRERRFLSLRLLALAAAVVVAVIGWLVVGAQKSRSVESRTIARCVLVTGDVVAAAPDEGDAQVTPSSEFREGTRIQVRNGLMTLQTSDGGSVRFAPATNAVLMTETRVALARGAVYVDTQGRAGSIEIVTPFGTARDIGTQFQVRVDETAETMRVSVREGEVIVRQNGTELSVVEGQGVVLKAGEEVKRAEVATWGEEWSWVVDAAPRFEIEGRTLSDYLDWVSRETGLRVQLDDPMLARVVGETTLHGSTGDLRPNEAVLVVLRGAGLEGEIANGVLTVRPGD